MTYLETPQRLNQARSVHNATEAAPDPLVPTVFHETWWLDLATKRRWADTEVREDGRVIGRLPYCIERHLRGADIGMPPLTHFLGPAIAEGQGSEQARWLKRTAVTQELIRTLPSPSTFWQKFHRGVTDVVPFQAERFDTSVQFTFEIQPAPESQLWAALRDKHRNVIRKAQTRFAIEVLRDPAEFTDLYERNLKARGARRGRPAT